MSESWKKTKQTSHVSPCDDNTPIALLSLSPLPMLLSIVSFRHILSYLDGEEVDEAPYFATGTTAYQPLSVVLQSVSLCRCNAEATRLACGAFHSNSSNNLFLRALPLTRVAGLPASAIERVPAVKGRDLLRGHVAAGPRKGKECQQPGTAAGPGGSASSPSASGRKPEVLDRLCHLGLLSPLGRLRLEAPESDKIWGMDLTDGAVGCALSHVKVWSHILLLENGCAAALGGDADEPPLPPESDLFPFYELPLEREARREYLVVEDDAIFTDDFLSQYATHVTAARGQPLAAWDLLYLGGLDTGGQCAELRLPHPAETCAPSRLCRVPALHRTTSAYVVTERGADRLLQVCLPLTFQLDTEMTRQAAAVHTEASGGERGGWSGAKSPPIGYVRDPPSLTLQPPLVHQDAAFESDIQLPTA
eukprot:gene8202-5727_t